MLARAPHAPSLGTGRSRRALARCAHAYPARVRIGFLIDRWDPRRGGAEALLARCATHLESSGHEVLVFADACEAGAVVRFERVRARGWTRAARERYLAEALVEAARQRACTLTIALRHVPRADLYWPHAGLVGAGRAARARAAGRAAPALGARERFQLECERALLERGGARAIACVSSLVERELVQAYPACRERLFALHNGVELERFDPARRALLGRALRARLGADERTVVLAFAARDAALKGLGELLAALAQLPSLPWRLCVAGPRRLRPWRARARALGLDPARVLWESELDPAELYAAADLCVHPSWRDACALVVLEALASGVPVLTTRLVGASELVSEAFAGSVLDEPRPALLRAELERWIGALCGGPVAGPGERARVRSLVAGHSQQLWLARTSAALERLAAQTAERAV
jgi:UDP-glucose:(heptosyl)LPS alpha-1,3-glucosyltransferase